MESHERWELWLKWVIVEMAGFGLGLWSGVQITGWFFPRHGFFHFDLNSWPTFIATVTSGIACGALVGALEWSLVLRSYIPGLSPWWIAASTVGWGAAGLMVALSYVLLLFNERPVTAGMVVVLMTVISGTPVAMLQWILLRRHLHKARWWIVARAIGGGILFPISAAVTSVALAWLVHYSRVVDTPVTTEVS